MNPQGVIATAAKYLGTRDFNNFCQKFIEQITQGRTGLYPSAIAAWKAQQNKAVKGTQGLQPGDLIYFSPNAGNGNYGHVGIYAGNGRFISATANGVQESDLSQWQKATGQQILGYIPQGDRTAVDSARLNGNTINNAIFSTQDAIKQKLQQLQAMQTPQQPMPQMPTQQQQQPVNPSVTMPSIQNPAGQSIPNPIQDSMSTAQGRQPGMTTNTLPTMPQEYRGTGYSSQGQLATQSPTMATTGTGANAYLATLSQQEQQKQQEIANAQAALQQSMTAYTPTSYNQTQNPQNYTFGNITVQA